TVLSTTLMRAGKYGLVGLSNVYDASDASESFRFDPEGARLVGSELFVADEYGPLLCVFGLEGGRRRVIPAPAKFGIARPDARAVDKDRQNGSGRVANRALKGWR
ncbi:MAG TPA: esterase-like activity of phytase family protein, partial [Phycisphaerales bacterium]|nr:esterase-like activity of phytase family protein [Phycisphaerales bacterium]